MTPKRPDQAGLFPDVPPRRGRGRPRKTDQAADAAERARPGRLERALMAELAETALPDAAKLHLRAQAHLLDIAEARGEVADGTKAALGLLQLRQAYGLAGQATSPLDSFTAFVAGMNTVGDARPPQ